MGDENHEVTMQKLEKQQEQCQNIYTDFDNSPKEIQLTSSWSGHRILCLAAEALVGIILMCIFWWLVTWYAIYSEKNQAEQISNLVILIMMYTISIVIGQIITTISTLSPIMGMILAGILFGKWISFTFESYNLEIFIIYITKITPFVILIISVLELNVWEFRQISNSLVRLVVVSFIIEVGFIGVFTYILQFETLAWAQFSSYGFIWPAICPAVLVPSLLQLKRMGYGEESGVINLLVAASCILEVLTNMTDGFLECLSVFNVSSTYVKIILFAEELFIELGIGIIFGVIMMFVPSNAWTKLSSILKKRKNDNPHINKNQNIVSLLSIIRAILLCFVGLLIGLYKWYTDLPITYSLGCAISTILASTSWKCKNQNNINPTISSSKGINNQAQHEINAISKIFEFIWNVLHPLIFVLIGYDLSYTIYSINTAMVLTGIIIFMVVIIIRIITATCSVWGTGFNYNEIIFINMAWIVNSSIMTCFTTTSHLFGQTPLEDFYNQIVLIIGIFLLLRVFLGSFVIHKFGPILLTNTVQYGH